MNDTIGTPNVGQGGDQRPVTAMAWLGDPDDWRNQAALAWTCDICKARIKHFCTNTIRPGEPLPGRVNHIARLVDRRTDK